MLLGIPPAWYKSLAYRSRAVVDPRGVLTEFGVELPDGVEVRVHDSTADLRYLVLPMRPEGHRGLERGAARRPRHARLHDRHGVARCSVEEEGRVRFHRLNGNVCMKRLSKALVIGFLTVLSASPAAAHHPMGGTPPSTFVEGLLSGFGHPVIGPDHLAFSFWRWEFWRR